MDLRDQSQQQDTRFHTVRGKEPRFHDDPSVDRLFAMVAALTAELCVLRDRLDTHERLAEAGKIATQANIDDYMPDDDAAAARQERRMKTLQAVYRVITEGPRAARRDVKRSEADYGYDRDGHIEKFIAELELQPSE